jgi:hypothetical protein
VPGNDGRNLPPVLLKGFGRFFIVVPGRVHVVGNIFFKNAGGIYLLRPGSDAVIMALEENDLFPAGMRPRRYHGKGRRVSAVFCEKARSALAAVSTRSPAKSIITVEGAVTRFPSALFCRRFINIFIIASQQFVALQRKIV